MLQCGIVHNTWYFVGKEYELIITTPLIQISYQLKTETDKESRMKKRGHVISSHLILTLYLPTDQHFDK